MFFGGEGIQNPTHRVHLFRDLRRRALFGPFEQKVLDEVGDPVLVRGFMAGTILYPDPQTHRTVIQHLLGNNSEPVVEDSLSEHEERIGSLGYF